ncbi:hypothetical protein K431DRAFT_27475 [Polychaeton citri CBS 116435]|uniref:Uncharacterized protein n=1 Tax=Polychaeton citri CBS 116435 TaxID=1314669 RepID=A0A9P4QEB7_9PEZI|nr:hypothetical protein K431DRAFT_27475 [Polychaeton citri CBS 116435]
MMPQAAKQQPPPSPSALLWAYQIKREHAFLMNRVKDVEALTAQHDQHIRSSRSKPEPASSEEVSGLAQRVQSIAHTHDAAAEQLMRDLNAKMDTIQTENEALTIKISSLDSLSASAEKEREMCSQDRANVLARITELDANLSKYVASLEGLKQTINDQQAESVATVVNGLRQEVQHDGAKVTDYPKKMAAIQQANKMLVAATHANERKLAQIESEIAAAHADKINKIPKRRGRPPLHSKRLPPRALPGDINALRNITAVRKAQRPGITTPRPRIGSKILNAEATISKPRRGRPPLNKAAGTLNRSPAGPKKPLQKTASQQKVEAQLWQHDDSIGSPLASISFLVRKDGVTERPKGTACKPCARAHVSHDSRMRCSRQLTSIQKRCTHGFTNDDLEASQKRLKMNAVNRPAVVQRSQSRPRPKVQPRPMMPARATKPPAKRKVPVHERWVYVEEPMDSETESGSDESQEGELKDEGGHDQSNDNTRMRKRKSEAQRLKSSAKKLLADLSEGAVKRRTRYSAPARVPNFPSKKDTEPMPKRPRGRPRKYPKIEPNNNIVVNQNFMPVV